MPSVQVAIRVPFPDVDLSRRIHFTAMFRYMEVAEHELMRSIDFPLVNLFQEFGVPRVHVACDYKAALHYDDWVVVKADVTKVGRTSWTLHFTMRSVPSPEIGDEGVIVATGEMTVVLTDLYTHKATPLPDRLRQALTDA